MSENEVETGQETTEEKAEVQGQPSAEKAAETGQETAEAQEQAPVKGAETAQAAAKEVAEAKEVPPAKEKEKPKATKAVASEQPAPAEATKVKKSAATEEIMATIKKMTVLELAELVKVLETEFGVSAAAPVVAAPSTPTETAAPTAEEQTEFSVILKDMGANKINVIKAVREVTTLGLKESKDLVESAPKAVREGVNKEEAAAIKEKLETAGATAEIK